jgi:hypothetical protein
MITFLVQYTDPRLRVTLNEKIQAENRTDARDKFFELFTDIERIDKITRVLNIAYHE